MRKWLAVIVMFSIALCFPFKIYGLEEETVYEETLADIVETAMERTDTPGVSIAVVTENGISTHIYGYADREQSKPVTPSTAFEIGSMSKAFTALGILYLEQEGKLSLTDDLRQYIPWLSLRYEGQYKGRAIEGEVPVTIANALYQTTGIPFESIGEIPAGTSDHALEDTVRTLIGTELDFYPGSRYSYATINYDILGLIIEIVSGESYEAFLEKTILSPLGLTHTYARFGEMQENSELAVGYKREGLSAKRYDAPSYRGNTPAGYIVSTAEDMARWMQIQMGLVQVEEPYASLIEKSHVGNASVASTDGYLYGAGWNVQIRGEEINHGGSNPNFSSMLSIDYELGMGICVLTNLNSNAGDYITKNFWNALYERESSKFKPDVYQMVDTVFTLVFFAGVLLSVVFFVLLIIAAWDIVRKRRNRDLFTKGKIASFLLSIVMLIFLCFCVYYIPNVILARLPWKAVTVWGSSYIERGCQIGCAAGILFFLYVQVTFCFPKPKEKSYITLIPLSVLNGLCSALIIFTINESFNRNLEYSRELLVYFLFSLIFFVYTTKLAQGRLIAMTNEVVYEKRIHLIEKILQSSYETIEKIGASRIYTSLNNDTEAISKIPGMIVGVASNLITMIFCLAYLLSNSLAAFLASIGVVLVNCGISFLTSQIAKRYWEKNRDVQDTYFRQMTDLVQGFKELLLNWKRKMAFWSEIKTYSRLSADLSKAASIKFLNFRLYNTLMYNIIFGVVVFLFPIFLIGIQTNDLRETLFMVFYLIGPFSSLMSTIPAVTQVRVNIGRIRELSEQLDEEGQTPKTIESSAVPQLEVPGELSLHDVVYEYENHDNQRERIEFSLGPVNIQFARGEIHFITGGNGSGKSTLAKLLTGLYTPTSGKICLDSVPCGNAELNQLFSAVYSDFYLFPKLYGIDLEQKRDEVLAWFKTMKIEQQIRIEPDGTINASELSTGQKKRLAFVLCCLDEKPFLLFDEWAAEQDPEFRQYFYTELLSGLKERGKGVIVITHDDRYFHLADHVVKLERGEVIAK